MTRPPLQLNVCFLSRHRADGQSPSWGPRSLIVKELSILKNTFVALRTLLDGTYFLWKCVIPPFHYQGLSKQVTRWPLTPIHS